MTPGPSACGFAVSATGEVPVRERKRIAERRRRAKYAFAADEADPEHTGSAILWARPRVWMRGHMPVGS
jgi:hypothetical protein